MPDKMSHIKIDDTDLHPFIQPRMKDWAFENTCRIKACLDCINQNVDTHTHTLSLLSEHLHFFSASVHHRYGLTAINDRSIAKKGT